MNTDQFKDLIPLDKQVFLTINFVEQGFQEIKCARQEVCC